eukprot:2556309-Prymnesium_polylepis.1
MNSHARGLSFALSGAVSLRGPSRAARSLVVAGFTGHVHREKSFAPFLWLEDAVEAVVAVAAVAAAARGGCCRQPANGAPAARRRRELGGRPPPLVLHSPGRRAHRGLLEPRVRRQVAETDHGGEPARRKPRCRPDDRRPSHGALRALREAHCAGAAGGHGGRRGVRPRARPRPLDAAVRATRGTAPKTGLRARGR